MNDMNEEAITLSPLKNGKTQYLKISNGSDKPVLITWINFNDDGIIPIDKNIEPNGELTTEILWAVNLDPTPVEYTIEYKLDIDVADKYPEYTEGTITGKLMN